MRTALGFCLTALLLAGCAGPAAPPPGERLVLVPASDAAEANGCLAGTVLGEDLLPIGGAKLVLRPTNQETTSGKDGRFELCGLPARRYQLDVALPGYEPWSRTLNVPLAEPELRILLRSAPVLEPHVLLVSKALHYTVGYATLDTTASRNGLNLTTCDPCTWGLFLERMPDFVHMAARWQRNPTPPQPGLDRMYHIFRGGAPFEAGTDIGAGSLGKPWAKVYTRDDLEKDPTIQAAKAGVPVSGSMYCDGSPLWPCVDQRIDVVLSFFYDHQEVPDGYTPFPPA